ARALLAEDPDRQDNAVGAQGQAGRGRGYDGGGPAPSGGLRDRAVDHSRRPPPDDRGVGGAASRDPARSGDRALLHLTQRGLERPGGAAPTTSRHSTRAAPGRRLLRLARQRLSDDRPPESGERRCRWLTRFCSWSTAIPTP